MADDFIELHLRRSSTLLFALCVAYGGAAVCVFSVSPSIAASLAGAAVLALLGVRDIRELALGTSRHSVRGVRQTGPVHWTLTRSDGIRFDRTRLCGVFCHPWLVGMRFEGKDGAKLTILVPRDGVDELQFRRLRVALRSRCQAC